MEAFGDELELEVAGGGGLLLIASYACLWAACQFGGSCVLQVLGINLRKRLATAADALQAEES